MADSIFMESDVVELSMGTTDERRRELGLLSFDHKWEELRAEAIELWPEEFDGEDPYPDGPPDER